MKNERLLSLRNQMKEAGVHCMVIPTSDYHNSEYVSDFFMARKYFSGFTGSAGTLVVTPDEAALFTDGRYFIQAAKELKDSYRSTVSFSSAYFGNRKYATAVSAAPRYAISAIYSAVSAAAS